MEARKFLKVENANIIFKNFEGKAKKFNPEGNRNFNLVLDPEIAEELKEEGWNIRSLEPRNPGDPVLYTLSVAVAFKFYPPNIVLIDGDHKTILREEDVKALDWAEIENVDLSIRPRQWQDTDGKTRIKAYLRSMYVTIVHDELADKYYDGGDNI